MDAYRLSDKADARRLLRELPKEHKTGRVATADQVGAPTGAGSAELVSDAGRIELDPAEIAAAQAEIDRHHDELTALLAHAAELQTPLRDGFADALGDFSRSLENQVQTTARNARDLGELTAKAAKTYHAQEDATAHELRATDISGVLG